MKMPQCGFIAFNSSCSFDPDEHTKPLDWYYLQIYGGENLNVMFTFQARVDRWDVVSTFLLQRYAS